MFTRVCLRRSTPWQITTRRFVSDFSSVQEDRNELAKIMSEEADKAEAQAAAWLSKDVRSWSGEPFVAPSLDVPQRGLQFIRPHYWSHEHRFEKRRHRLTHSPVAPGKREARQQDPLRHFGIDPLYETSNTTLLASFLSEMGKIRNRVETKLTAKTQRRIGKAIRRAKMMGILPQLSNPRIGPRPL
ncbi:hypothetical protein V8B97DRAFT_2001786 [Scleroderma yunnanense]